MFFSTISTILDHFSIMLAKSLDHIDHSRPSLDHGVCSPRPYRPFSTISRPWVWAMKHKCICFGGSWTFTGGKSNHNTQFIADRAKCSPCSAALAGIIFVHLGKRPIPRMCSARGETQCLNDQCSSGSLNLDNSTDFQCNARPELVWLQVA